MTPQRTSRHHGMTLPAHQQNREGLFVAFGNPGALRFRYLLSQTPSHDPLSIIIINGDATKTNLSEVFFVDVGPLRWRARLSGWEKKM